MPETRPERPGRSELLLLAREEAVGERERAADQREELADGPSTSSPRVANTRAEPIRITQADLASTNRGRETPRHRFTALPRQQMLSWGSVKYPDAV